MSKAVTNEEVEDVLSSIRRLVSEDKRPLAGLRSAPVAAPEAAEPVVEDEPHAVHEEAGKAETVETFIQDAKHEAERFVLTPALRVQTPEPHGDGADEGPLDLGSVARDTWMQNAEDVDELVFTTSGRPEENGPLVLVPTAKAPDNDAAMDALDALVHDAIENEVKAIEDEIDVGDYADEGFWEDKEDDASPQDARDTDDADEDHGSNKDSFEFEDYTEDDSKWDLREDSDDRLDDHSEAADGPVKEAAVVEGTPVEEAPFFDGEVEAVLHPSEAAPKKPTPYMPLTAKIAALEAVLGGRRQEYEPDGDEAEELAAPDAPTMTWEDDVELDAKGEPFLAPVEDVQDIEPEIEIETVQPSTAFTADDQVMDEEALRELVSEIVRSELQGALGERITRNVRKLVRREIHRALTAQEME